MTSGSEDGRINGSDPPRCLMLDVYTGSLNRAPDRQRQSKHKVHHLLSHVQHGLKDVRSRVMCCGSSRAA